MKTQRKTRRKSRRRTGGFFPSEIEIDLQKGSITALNSYLRDFNNPRRPLTELHEIAEYILTKISPKHVKAAIERLIAYNPDFLLFPNNKNELLFENANSKFRSLLQPRLPTNADFLSSLQKKPVYLIMGHGVLETSLFIKQPDSTRVPENCTFLNFTTPGELLHSSALLNYFIEQPSFGQTSLKPLFAIRDITELYGVAKTYTVKSTNFANNELDFTKNKNTYRFSPSKESIRKHIRTHTFHGAFSQLESFYRVPPNFRMNNYSILFEDDLFRMGIYRYDDDGVQFIQPPKKWMFLSQLFNWISEKEPEGALIASFACSDVENVQTFDIPAQTQAMRIAEERTYANEMRFRELNPVLSKGSPEWSAFRSIFPTIDLPMFLFDFENEMRLGFYNPSEENMATPHKKLTRANLARGYPPLSALPRTSLSAFAQMNWNKVSE